MSTELIDDCSALFQQVENSTKALDAAGEALEAQIAALRAPVPRGEPRPDREMLDERERQLRAAAERKAQPLYEGARRALDTINARRAAFSREAVVGRQALFAAEEQRVSRFGRMSATELLGVLEEGIALDRPRLVREVKGELTARAEGRDANDVIRFAARRAAEAFDAMAIPEAERAAPLFREAKMLSEMLDVRFVRLMRRLQPEERLKAFRRGLAA